MDFVFENFNLLFLAVGILLAPLAFKFSLSGLKQRQDKVREIAVRLGLDLNDPAAKMTAGGEPIDAASLMPELQENARTRGAKPEDIERILKLPLLGTLIQLSLPWKMTGKIANTVVRANPVHENETHTIHFHAFFEPRLGFEITIAPECVAHKIGKMLLAQLRDVQIGDPAFDSKLFVRGDDTAAIQNWILHGNRKNVLLEFFAANPNASLDRNGLHYVEHKDRIDLETFQKNFELLTRTVRQLA